MAFDLLTNNLILLFWSEQRRKNENLVLSGRSCACCWESHFRSRKLSENCTHEVREREILWEIVVNVLEACAIESESPSARLLFERVKC